MSYMYNMEPFNLLDLDNDVSNIIGDYVKRDNRIKEEKFKRDMFYYVDIMMKIERNEARKGNTI
jgi:hypothetical protein